VWYVIGNSAAFTQLNCNYLEISALISFSISFFIVSYKFIDDIYFNSKIADLMYLPIKIIDILIIILRKNMSFQLLGIVMIYFPCILVFGLKGGEFFPCVVLTIFLTVVLDFIMLIISLTICMVSSLKNIGYRLITFQYFCFLGYSFFIKKFIFSLVFHEKSYAYDIWSFIVKPNMIKLLAICVITFFLFIISIKLYLISYTNTYYKISSFKNRKKKHSQKGIVMIKYTYLFIELKRIIRKKEILFYSSLKSIITIIIVTKILLNKISAFNMESANISYMIIATLISSINAISTTSFSSDYANISYFRMLPINFKKLFKAKVLVSFMFNELLIVIYTMLRLIVERQDLNSIPLLILYSTITNYICAWLGVYLDYSAPLKTNSDNELLHGNPNKLGVVIYGGLILFAEIWFTIKVLKTNDILQISAIVNIIILMATAIFNNTALRRDYDTD
jgi:ABC-2 type transport system permease protein